MTVTMIKLHIIGKRVKPTAWPVCQANTVGEEGGGRPREEGGRGREGGEVRIEVMVLRVSTFLSSKVKVLIQGCAVAPVMPKTKLPKVSHRTLFLVFESCH